LYFKKIFLIRKRFHWMWMWVRVRISWTTLLPNYVKYQVGTYDFKQGRIKIKSYCWPDCPGALICSYFTLLSKFVHTRVENVRIALILSKYLEVKIMYNSIFKKLKFVLKMYNFQSTFFLMNPYLRILKKSASMFNKANALRR